MNWRKRYLNIHTVHYYSYKMTTISLSFHIKNIFVCIMQIVQFKRLLLALSSNCETVRNQNFWKDLPTWPKSKLQSWFLIWNPSASNLCGKLSNELVNRAVEAESVDWEGGYFHSFKPTLDLKFNLFPPEQSVCQGKIKEKKLKEVLWAGNGKGCSGTVL